MSGVVLGFGAFRGLGFGTLVAQEVKSPKDSGSEGVNLCPRVLPLS